MASEHKPFHESVVDVIRCASSEELETIGTFLLLTTIPKDHDKIVTAWNTRCLEMCWRSANIQHITKSVLRQKYEIEAKKEENKNSLDRFQLGDEKHA